MKKIIYAMALSLFAITNSIAQTTHNFKAAKLTEGSGLHNDKIWWINWDINNNGMADDNLVAGLTGTYTAPSGYKYNITLNNIKIYNASGTQVTSGNDYKLNSANTRNYGGNNFPHAYRLGNSTTVDNANQEVFALSNTTDKFRVTFTLTVKAIEPGSTVETNPKGIVIAGSETLSSTSEYYSLKANNGKIKIIDRYINGDEWCNFNTAIEVSEGGKKIKATNTAGGDSKGDVMLYAEGASVVDVELKGGGLQHIALGFYEGIDYSDAPLPSYGEASHSMEPGFSGEGLTDGNYTIQNQNIPGETNICYSNTHENSQNNWYFSKELGLMMLGESISAESEPYTGDASNDYQGGDSDNAIPGSFDRINQSINVFYKNNTDKTGYVRIWIDENRNGQFEESEKRFANIVAPAFTSGNKILNLQTLYNLEVGNRYQIRLRISSDPNLPPTGYAQDGEVEDYNFLILGIPNDIMGKVFYDENGGTPDGTPMEGIHVKLLQKSNNTVIKETTTSADGEYLFQFIDTGDFTVIIEKPVDKQHSSSTDTTPKDGRTDITIVGENIYNIDFGLYDAVCYKPALQISTLDNSTKHGITSLKATERYNSKSGKIEQWPMIHKGAWTALEGKTKGFLINRVDAQLTSQGGQVPQITDPVEGMVIYDTTNDCIKIYDGTKWKCFNQQGCPINN